MRAVPRGALNESGLEVVAGVGWVGEIQTTKSSNLNGCPWPTARRTGPIWRRRSHLGRLDHLVAHPNALPKDATDQDVGRALYKRLSASHAHIGVTATVYAHGRLCLQCDAIESSATPSGLPPSLPFDPTTATTHPFVQHPSADVAINYCRQAGRKPPTPSPTLRRRSCWLRRKILACLGRSATDNGG